MALHKETPQRSRNSNNSDGTSTTINSSQEEDDEGIYDQPNVWHSLYNGYR
jgi:hypothetical protein